MTELITEARNASLDDMIKILRDQYARRLDIVLPSEKIRFEEGQLRLKGVDTQLGEDGVTDPNGLYLPTAIFDEKLAGYLGMGTPYTRKLRTERPDLYDANANGWLHGRRAKARRATPAEVAALETEENALLHFNEDQQQWWFEQRAAIPADKRSFLLRLFQGNDAEHGVARVILSNRYKTIDNLDGLMALLAGLKEANIDPGTLDFRACDVTERRMYVKVDAPEVKVLAPELLKGYRNPFGQGAERADAAVRGRGIDEWRQIAQREGMAYTEEEGGEPIVSAGFVFTNSETGGGAFSVLPQIVVQVCKNGLTMDVGAFGRRHAGVRLEEGIRWSDDTQETNLKLITQQVRDVVAEFMTVEYVQARVDELEERAGIRLKKPADEIKVIAKKLAFSDTDTAGILEHFMMGGQITAGGVMQAITSYSQTLDDADAAFELDRQAVKALDLAAAAG